MVKLGDICVINPKSPVFEDDFFVSFVPMQKVGENGEFDASDMKKYSEVKKGFTYFQNGDVLFAKITPCMENGKGAIARNLQNEIGFGSTEFHILRPKNSNVLSEWVYYLLSWSNFRKEAENNMTGSAGQKRVPKLFLENYNVNLPSLEKQKKQINSLAKLDDVITLRKQQLSKLDELVKSRFIELFGDCENRECLGNVATFIKTGKLDANAEVKDGDYPFFTCDSVPKRIDKHAFDMEAILISGNGSQVGHIHYYNGKFNAYQRTYVLGNFLPSFDVGFIKVYLEMELKLYIMKNKKGSAVPYITLPMLQDFLIPKPPLNEQQAFSSFVEQTDKSKLAIQKSLEKLETLKKALMQKYFG